MELPIPDLSKTYGHPYEVATVPLYDASLTISFYPGKSLLEMKTALPGQDKELLLKINLLPSPYQEGMFFAQFAYSSVFPSIDEDGLIDDFELLSLWTKDVAEFMINDYLPLLDVDKAEVVVGRRGGTPAWFKNILIDNFAFYKVENNPGAIETQYWLDISAKE